MTQRRMHMLRPRMAVVEEVVWLTRRACRWRKKERQHFFPEHDYALLVVEGEGRLLLQTCSGLLGLWSLKLVVVLVREQDHVFLDALRRMLSLLPHLHATLSVCSFGKIQNPLFVCRQPFAPGCLWKFSPECVFEKRLRLRYHFGKLFLLYPQVAVVVHKEVQEE